MPPVVNLSRVKVVHPGGTILGARFAFHNGRAAVWTEDKSAGTADRLLYATDATFIKSNTARLPHQVVISDDETWEVRRIGGGCGCGGKVKAFSLEQLLDPDFSHYP